MYSHVEQQLVIKIQNPPVGRIPKSYYLYNIQINQGAELGLF